MNGFWKEVAFYLGIVCFILGLFMVAAYVGSVLYSNDLVLRLLFLAILGGGLLSLSAFLFVFRFYKKKNSK